MNEVNEVTKRFNEVEVGDMIEVEFSNQYTAKESSETRNGIVEKIKYDEDLKSNVIVFNFYIIAEYRLSDDSAKNTITKIIKKSINPEYFL